jgi:hypothetical protein
MRGKGRFFLTFLTRPQAVQSRDREGAGFDTVC